MHYQIIGCSKYKNKFVTDDCRIPKQNNKTGFAFFFLIIVFLPLYTMCSLRAEISNKPKASSISL